MAGTGTAHLRGEGESLLRVENLIVDYRSRGRRVSAVGGISFDVLRGETLGIVGESGCGKSSTGRAILQLPPPTSGSVRFDSTELTALRGERLRRMRRRVAMIFQDPVAALNPRRTVGRIVAEPDAVWKRGKRRERLARAREALDAVGIDPRSAMTRRPHQFSGGQCQRINIARALASDPALIICDEPVSALDVSVQASILNLLQDLKEQRGLTMVFISHDLGVVKNVSDRVAVMYRGKLCEIAGPEELYREPAHPYTRLLLSSIPGSDIAPDPLVAEPAADAESSGDDKAGGQSRPGACRFRNRCPLATALCATEPQVRELAPGHFVACHHAVAPAAVA